MLIYHTGDLHNHGGIAERLRTLRAQHPGLLIDAGDALRGSQTMYYRREPILAEMGAAGYDLQGMGNREFHYFYPLVRARVRQMQHTLLCSNLVDVQCRSLPFQRERVLRFEGSWRLRIFSLLVPQYPMGSPWERLFGWRFLDPIQVAQEIAESVSDDEVLLCISHLGKEMDQRLAAAVPRLDLVLGGHSHDTLTEPLYVGKVPIVHAGPYGRYVSRTDLQIDPETERVRIAQFALLPLREPVALGKQIPVPPRISA